MSTGLIENESAALAANASVANGGVSNAAVTCTSCGAANAHDSRFCRLCGAATRASSPSAPPSTESAALASAASAGSASQGASEANVFDRVVAPSEAATFSLPDGAASISSTSGAASGVVAVLSPSGVANVVSEEDARQARQLLDRAFTLVERGDMANAILSCRQSVALAHDSAQGFSMLGLLLERTGDLEQAAAAYARVLRLTPDSRLELESLDRIRATLNSRRGQAPAFRFDERELDEALASSRPTASPSAVTQTVVTVASTAPIVATSPAIAVSASGQAAGVPTSAIGQAAVVAAPLGGAMIGSARTTAPAPNDYSNAANPLIVGAGAAPSISALHFDAVDDEPEPWWRSALARPSAFSRGLPLAGVAGLSLLFLIWARGAALSRYPQDSQLPANIDSTSLKTGDVPPIPDPASPLGGTTSTVVAPNSSGPSAPAPGSSPDIAGPNDRYPVSNRPGQPVGAPNSAAPAPNGAAPNASVNAGNQNRGGQNAGGQGGQNMGSGRVGAAPPSVRQYPEASQRPQPVFPSTGRVLPPVNPSELAPARPLPAPAVAPAPYRSGNSGLSSGGGGPLGPATSSNRNAITLTPPRSPALAPPRTSNERAEAESAAIRAASRRPETAIANTNQAIRNGGETGWNYQRRGLSFLNRGDNQRAADDFQLAISAYNDQIARGDRVDEAKAGVVACRNGLTLAMERLGR